MKYIVYLILLLGTWACNEPIIITNPPIDTVPKPWQPEIVWRRQHGPTKFDQLAYRIELYKNKLIAGYQSEIGSGYWIYEKNTGEVLKDINDQQSFIGNFSSRLVGNYYHSKVSNKEYRLINLENFEVNKIDLVKAGYFGFTGVLYHDGYIYSGLDNQIGEAYNNRISLGRKNLADITENFEFVFDDTWPQDVPNPRSAHFGGLGFMENKNKNTILYYSNTQLYTDTILSKRLKFVAYNISKNRVDWQTEVKIDNKDPFSDGGGGLLPPVFYKDIVIFTTSRYVRAFDKETGKLLWDLNLEQITTTDYAVIDNYFFIANNFGVLHKIDLNTGQILSKLDLKTGNTGVWQEHKGILYFTMVGNKLYAIDAANMTVKWEWKSPNRVFCSYCSFGNNSPVIDKEMERLYITDGREMFCIKLPE
jgi:outer membrane protein assembly factor BamB